MNKQVKRYKWQSKNGQEHEDIAVFISDGRVACSFTLDEAEQVGRDLLRVAAEWRQERGEAAR
jgi:hypothetical protein